MKIAQIRVFPSGFLLALPNCWSELAGLDSIRPPLQEKFTASGCLIPRLCCSTMKPNIPPQENPRWAISLAGTPFLICLSIGDAT